MKSLWVEPNTFNLFLKGFVGTVDIKCKITMLWELKKG